MTSSNEEAKVDRATLLLSTQTALLGVIGVQVLGVCLQINQKDVEMIVFSGGQLSEDEKEAFDAATTEIMGNFSPIILVDVRFIENATSPLKSCSGLWVFVRYGCLVRS